MTIKVSDFIAIKRKKKRKRFFLFLFLILLVNYFVFSLGFNNMHEEAHAAIGRNFGCVDYTVESGVFKGYFLCHHYINRTEDMKNKEEELHSINEIVYYNLQVIFAAMFLCTAAILAGMSHHK